MNTNLNLSSANQSYIEKPANKISYTSAPDTNQNPKKSNTIRKAGLCAFLTAAVLLAICKYRQINGIGVKIIFKKGLALDANSFRKYSGKYTFKNKAGKFTFEFKNGIIQKSTKKGENGFVKKYIWENNELSKVTKDSEIIDIKAIKTKINSIFDKCNELKEKLEIQKLEFNNSQNKPNNSVLSEVQILKEKIEYIETRLQINENGLGNTKLNKNQEAVLKRQLGKLQELRNYYLKNLAHGEKIKELHLNTIHTEKIEPEKAKETIIILPRIIHKNDNQVLAA